MITFISSETRPIDLTITDTRLTSNLYCGRSRIGKAIYLHILWQKEGGTGKKDAQFCSLTVPQVENDKSVCQTLCSLLSMSLHSLPFMKYSAAFILLLCMKKRAIKTCGRQGQTHPIHDFSRAFFFFFCRVEFILNEFQWTRWPICARQQKHLE